MKKVIFLAMLVPYSAYSFDLRTLFHSKQPVPTPRVLTIKINDPIPFETVGQTLFNATKRSDVQGVVLLINSYGGDVAEFCVLYDMIKKMASVKPVVCLISACAYSCGYMLASAADFIFAHSLSGVGSIGVFRSIERYKNVRVKDGHIEADLKNEIFFAGEWKGVSNPYAPELTEKQRAVMRSELMKTYDAFVTMVADNRRLDKTKAKEWAEGRTFSAPDALKIGLIDAVGTIFDAEEKMKQLIKERYQLSDVRAVDMIFES